jgi:Tfp pilus assembly protein PilO
MKDRILARLTALDPRMVAAILSLLVLFVTLESWMLVLRAPLAERHALQALHEQTESLPATESLQTEVQRARETVAHTEAALRQMALTRSDDDTVLQLIATLDQAAQTHAVQLGQVRSTARRIDPDVVVATFEADARGDYLPLTAWLSDIEARIAPLRTTEVRLGIGDQGRQVTMQLKFSAYLPIPEASGAP